MENCNHELTSDDGVLSLIEKKVASSKNDTEKITRLFDMSYLLKELYESKQREKNIRLELSKQQDGGNKMGFGSKLIMAGTIAAAAYGFFGMSEARKETEKIKNERYTSSELVEFSNLKSELGLQINSASSYLERAESTEVEFKQLTVDAVEYIKNSRPVGELEESAELEIKRMNNFFEGCNIDSILEDIQTCKESHQEYNILTSTKQELKDRVSNANDSCKDAYESIASHSDNVTNSLIKFKEYVESHPLKGRSEMVKRIDGQISVRPALITEGMHYSSIFAQNNSSDGVIPVTVQQPYKIAQKD